MAASSERAPAGGRPGSAPRAATLLRVVFGLIMFSHGLPKLMGTSHGSMADPMAASVKLIDSVLHLPAAPLLGLLVALLEGVGGLMLAAGLLTRPVALLMALQMVAISYILGPTWPWIDRGIEYPVLMLFTALFFAAQGGGMWSLDGKLMLMRRR
ncbi:DoxX family protein [Herbaspirillum sp. LeCh32-8]|uniref:DoxX family protein n=1 Tax=Herbaspirillum sp. LeCh32-8 TaxID=2821356 RepID=UPI001AE5C6D1|nr:DoxX family protein [Herbaspirillum sp. LeCh32-8]MBP0598173.1 DoxX family protein [Herbaspirillum sp. LeCh32-8]